MATKKKTKTTMRAKVKGARRMQNEVKKKRGGARPSTGGARKGSGRVPLYGKEKLDEKVPTRYNDEQGKAIFAFCQRKRINPNLFLREASLLQAGLAKLGAGLEKCYGTLREGKELKVPDADGVQMPVKYTATQHAALEKHCDKHGIQMATFVKDAGLTVAGRPELTLAHQHKQLAQNLAGASKGAA